MSSLTGLACAAAVADWGTSNLRIWLLNSKGGVLASVASNEGANGLATESFEAILRMRLAELNASWAPLRRLPVVICGMAGARNGWREAVYIPVPAAPELCIGQAAAIYATGLDIRILPGFSNPDKQHPDVMRGEETQLLGLVETQADFSGLVCMPGTHSKWVRLERGRILDFHTALTGELFALLSEHSVLRHVMGGQAAFSADSAAFGAGLAEVLARPDQLILKLFSVRAAGLLVNQTGEAAAARLSGMLIGAELVASLAGLPVRACVTLVSAGGLAPLYARALGMAGRAFRLLDAEILTLAGLQRATRQLFPEILQREDA